MSEKTAPADPKKCYVKASLACGCVSRTWDGELLKLTGLLNSSLTFPNYSVNMIHSVNGSDSGNFLILKC